MGYRLEAVIGQAAVLSAAIGEQPTMAVVPLRQGLRLVPMTDEAFDAVNDGTPPGLPGFWKLPGGFARMLCTWSAQGPAAYVEADIFGGVGTQAAAVWDGGRLALGPAQGHRGLASLTGSRLAGTEETEWEDEDR